LKVVTDKRRRSWK